MTRCPAHERFFASMSALLLLLRALRHLFDDLLAVRARPHDDSGARVPLARVGAAVAQELHRFDAIIDADRPFFKELLLGLRIREKELVILTVEHEHRTA